MSYSRKQIDQLVKEVAEITGMATTSEEAALKGLNKILWCEFASVYGGYRLVAVNIETGGHYGVFGESSTASRKKAAEMGAYLTGIIAGAKVMTYDTKLYTVIK